MPSTSRRIVIAKAASFGAAPISSVIGRRALVDIGHPHVERHRTELESQAGDDKDHAEHQHRLVDLTGADGLEHFADLERAARPYIIDRP